VFLLHLDDCVSTADTFKPPKIQLIAACHPTGPRIVSIGFLYGFLYIPKSEKLIT
jgi:hypothetical protein